MIGLRAWVLVGATAGFATAPAARADLAAPQPVSVQVVIAPGDAGSVAAGSGGAVQTGPVNVNVQVIVDSPGAVTGPVAQTNSATGGMAAPATPPTPATPAVQTPATPATPPTPPTPTPPAPATPATVQAPPPPLPSSGPPTVAPAATTAPATSGGATPGPSEPEPNAHHQRSAGPHRIAAPGPVVHTAATPAPLITTASGVTRRATNGRRPAQAVKARAARHPSARPPLAPAHRLADSTQVGTGSGGGSALVLALLLAFLLAGPAGPAELVAALRQPARAAMGWRREQPG